MGQRPLRAIASDTISLSTGSPFARRDKSYFVEFCWKLLRELGYDWD